jgi:hypothetical protein
LVAAQQQLIRSSPAAAHLQFNLHLDLQLASPQSNIEPCKNLELSFVI